jgi:hypothetical protein
MTPAQSRIKSWREKPAKQVYEEFGQTPDKWQEDALDAFASGDPARQRVSLQACAGPGKTAVLAWCGWNFLSCYGEKGEHPKGMAMSMTEVNLKNNLWPELAKWQSRSRYLSKAFRWTKERIFAIDHPETWFLGARTWNKEANPEEQGRTLSGLHGKYILAIVDESGDIPVSVLKSAEQALSTGPKFGKILQAGNPTSHEGMLYAASTKLRHLWYIIKITGDPDDPKRSPRISIEWAREQIKLYGREDPWVRSYILGEFPESSINTLLTLQQVEAAMNRNVLETDYSFSQKRLGVDVARFGSDSTVIFPRQGLRAFKPVIMRGADGPQIAARIANAKAKWGSEVEFIDDTGGFGSTVIDSLNQAGISAFPVNFSSNATDPRYKNKRAEMWLEMADWIKGGGMLPNIPEIVAELTTTTYTFHNGKFLIEPKEKVKLKLGRSPDLADALALTFTLKDMPSDTASQMFPGFRQKKHLSDYDPYDSSQQ